MKKLVKKRFKTVYVEITNICNMNCTFCKKEKRKKEFMSLYSFEHIINNIKDYTNEVYLHVKGEPFLHPELNRILEICSKNNIIVNITTNATLLKDNLDLLINSKCIKQINLSLHSNLNNNKYLEDAFYVTTELNKKTDIYLNYRIWRMDASSDIVNKINEYFNVDINTTNKINDHLFVEFEHSFEWPTLSNDTYSTRGKCYGLINQVAILVDGSVTPCCLDSEAIIKLGNIYENSFEEIINNEKSLDIINGFKNNYKCEALCRHCDFMSKRNKKINLVNN